MRHIRYILIDEMRFIGSRLFIQIDSRLREAFLEKKSVSFGGRSIILVGDLGQLPPVRDKPLYAGNTTGKVLWKNSTLLSLWTQYFHQQGNDEKQSSFHKLLTNIRNVEPILDDWDFLCHRLI
jgi:hypothetical protein